MLPVTHFEVPLSRTRICTSTRSDTNYVVDVSVRAYIINNVIIILHTVTLTGCVTATRHCYLNCMFLFILMRPLTNGQDLVLFASST